MALARRRGRQRATVRSLLSWTTRLETSLLFDRLRRQRLRPRLLDWVALASLALACEKDAAPLAQVRIIVDTDLPVEAFAVRLRLDVYSSSGAWIDSRDIGASSASDWPMSFTVFAPDDAARTALVRLRAYPEGALRDYLGERFIPLPSDAADPAGLVSAPPGSGAPRLVIAGTDVTPLREPDPSIAIDRLLVTQMIPGTITTSPVVLRGACAGTMADIISAFTCVDAESPFVAATAVASIDVPSPSVTGSFGAPVECTIPPRGASTSVDGAPLFDEEACVAGGAFVFGSKLASTSGDAASVEQLASTPLRLAQIGPLLVDRFEVTVGRWRRALGDGFRSPDQSPPVNDGPLDVLSADGGASTWSSRPMDREGFPLNNVTWGAARAFCRFSGGDLPTEAQWEWIATAAGRPFKSAYAWGDSPPTCDGVVYGRGNVGVAGVGTGACRSTPVSPGPADEASAALDVTPGAGIHNLGGNVSEWTLDSALPMNSACWWRAAVREPQCQQAGSTHRARRGGAWSYPPALLGAEGRFGVETRNNVYFDLGFRCVRAGTAP